MAKELLSENLTVILLTVWVVSGVVLLMSAGHRALWVFIIFGTFSGLLVFTRAEFFPVVVLGAILVTIVSYNSHRRYVAVAALLILPWVAAPAVQNYLAFEELIPLTSAGGRTFWLATIHSDTFFFSGKNKSILRQVYVPGKPGQTDKNFWRIATDNVRRDPLWYLEGVGARFFLVHTAVFGQPGARASLRNLITVLFLRSLKLGLVCGMWLGLVYLFRTPYIFAAILLATTYLVKFAFIHSIFNGGPRMFYPMYPVAVALATIGYEHLFAMRRRAPPNARSPRCPVG
jgi:hypothetical protein